MAFHSWRKVLGWVARSAKLEAARKRKAARLAVEALEDRQLLTVSVGNPVVLINFAPTGSPEGTALSLTSSVTDPGATITNYDWRATKDGTAYAAGTHANFGFRPTDNGLYVVSLQVTDSEGNTGTDSKTIVVNNVDPFNLNLNLNPSSIDENGSVTLGGSFSDPGTRDTHQVEINWGDGSSQILDLARGVLSFGGLDHTYADDAETPYEISVTVTDKDGGSGSTTRSLSVAGVAPTPTIAGAPNSTTEGAKISLSALATDPSPIDTKAGFAYAWTVTKNGAAYTDGTGDTLDFSPDDNGIYVVNLTATDQDGAVGSTSQSITVTNVAPTATITGPPASSPEGTALTLGSIATDPGIADTLSYVWSVTRDGKDYSGSTDAGFTFTPVDNGTYAVSLTVTDDDGDSTTTDATIEVTNVPPSAAILHELDTDENDAPTAAEGSEITLEASAEDAGVEDTLTYAWSVTKDGDPYTDGEGTHFSFTPDDNGSYVVTLTVTDNDGASGSDSLTIAVTNVAPTVAITGAPETSSEGTEISLGSSVADAGSADTLTYVWSVTKDGDDYDDGEGTSFSFTPNDNGSYVVSLTVTDDEGASTTDTKTIAVTNVAPSIQINGAPSGHILEGDSVALSVALSDPGSSDTQVYTWSVTRNGVPESIGASEEHATTFGGPAGDDGTYVISLTVTDKDGASTTDSVTIEVDNVAPTATITGAPTSSVEGTTINLGSSVGDPGEEDVEAGFSYSWSVTKDGDEYDDGTGASFSFTPVDNGSYVVNLIVTDKDGATSSDSRTISVTNAAPVATILDAPTSSSEGTEITLNGSATDAGTDDKLSFVWSVTKDDNAYDAGTGSSFSFTPDDNGTYVVMLTVTDNDGDSGSDSRTITVGNVAPTASITGAPETSPEGTKISLGSSVSDAGAADSLSYAWSVTKDGNAYKDGDGTTFCFTPDDNGSYVVSLTVTDDDGGTATDTKTIAVTNVAPTIQITGAPSGHIQEGEAVNLGGALADPGTADTHVYTWTVTRNGDAIDLDDDEEHLTTFGGAPQDDGTYVITLTVTDKDGASASDSVTVEVDNVAPTVSITGVPTSSVEGTTINLGSAVSDPGDADEEAGFSYAWTVTKDGNAYTDGTGSSFSFTPTDNGSYVVSLTVTDKDGATGTDSQTINVTNAPPVVSITNGPTVSLPAWSEIALGSSVSDPGSSDSLSYNWSVTLDGEEFELPEEIETDGETFTFTPEEGGTYEITLTVTDDDGDSGSSSVSVVVTNTAPTAMITHHLGTNISGDLTSPEGIRICLGSEVEDLTPNFVHTYAWSVTKDGQAYSLPGDVATDGTSFRFRPDDNGTYVVSLQVENQHDDSGFDSVTIYVTNVAPLASIVNAPSSVLEGSVIDLTSTVSDPGTADIITYAWSVTKDGNAFSSGTAAAFSFTADDNGSYVVSLTVTDDDGDSSTTSTTVEVTNVAPSVGITHSLGTDGGGNLTATEGSTIALGSSVTDPGTADTLTYAWSVTKDGNAYASGSAATFDFTPNDNGTYVVSLTVTDDDGASGTDSATIVVTNVNPTAIINGIGAYHPEGSAIPMTAGVSDPGTQDTFTYAWQVKKNGFTVYTGTGANFTFTPQDSGIYTVKLTVTDKDGGVGVLSQDIDVANVAPTASITGVPSSNPTEGTTINLGSTASDPSFFDQLGLNRSWLVTKNGATYKTGTGSSFNFKPDDNGTYVVTLTVSDDDGGSVTDTATIVVDNAAPTGSINGGSNPRVNHSVNLNANNVQDPSSVDDATLTYLWTVKRGATTIATGSNSSISFTPQFTGTYQVTLKVTDKDGAEATFTKTLNVTS